MASWFPLWQQDSSRVDLSEDPAFRSLLDSPFVLMQVVGVISWFGTAFSVGSSGRHVLLPDQWVEDMVMRKGDQTFDLASHLGSRVTGDKRGIAVTVTKDHSKSLGLEDSNHCTKDFRPITPLLSNSCSLPPEAVVYIKNSPGQPTFTVVWTNPTLMFASYGFFPPPPSVQSSHISYLGG